MKKAYLTFCVIAGALIGTVLAERAVRNDAQAREAVVPGSVASGAVYCPLFPIGQYSDGTMMFYTELYYDSSTCTNPYSGWYVGDAPDWPYYCPQCMLAGFQPTGERTTGVASGFDGLDEKVAADFRPSFPHVTGTTILGEDFVEIPVSGTQLLHRVKLLRIRVSTAAGDRKPIERVIGLGYEVESVPASAPTVVVQADQLSAVEGASRGYRLELGGQQFLVFLAK